VDDDRNLGIFTSFWDFISGLEINAAISQKFILAFLLLPKYNFIQHQKPFQ
jgi:hypothetical protein